MEIEKKVEQIWKNNPKIPFMQAKEILQLGYTIGKGDAAKNPIQVVENSNNFIGTTKDLIDYANKKGKDKDDPEIKRLKLTGELNVLNTKVKISADIINYIKNHQDFWSIFDYVKEENEKYREELYKFKINNGLQDRR